MKLLAFETSTEACSVAVWVDGTIVERHEIAPRRHAECALPWAEALLAEAGIARAQLDAVAVGRGPGAFTGVRLGVALAQGVALALDLPVVPVSTLAALALAAGLPGDDERAHAAAGGSAGDDAPPSRQVLATIDARMHEVYAGRFALAADPMSGGAIARALGQETVTSPALLALPDTGVWHAAGTGLGAEAGLLQARLAAQPGLRLAAVRPEALPRAADIARLAIAACARGQTVAPERLEPAYLRDKVALTLDEQAANRAAAVAR